MAAPSTSPRLPFAASQDRILIVDDSVVARAVIARMVTASGRFAVAGSVADVPAALDFLARERVHFILLDIQMPGIDGLSALPDMIAAGRGAKVVMVSSMAGNGAAASVQALALGAADTLVKPGTGELSMGFAELLVDRLERLADGNPSVAAAPAPRPLPEAAAGGAFDVVAIGASTGGIHALSGLLRALPASFTLPILVTQHLPASFMPYFAAQLALVAGRPCDVATDRLRIRPGRIIVAPGDAHMCCVALPGSGGAIRLNRKPSASGCMPSVDPMLASLAEVYGARLLAVILSGMGRDGADGARRAHEAGGALIVQDQASSVIWGMPGTVAAMGIADAILPPDAIGRLVAASRRP